jgi:hypothetical protein
MTWRARRTRGNSDPSPPNAVWKHVKRVEHTWQFKLLVLVGVGCGVAASGMVMKEVGEVISEGVVQVSEGGRGEGEGGGGRGGLTRLLLGERGRGAQARQGRRQLALLSGERGSGATN